MKKALLFLNGNPPTKLPDTQNYTLIACTDGAFHYLKQTNFPIKKLDFISGDFDSNSGKDDCIYKEKFIYTPDQNKTDFHKALEIIIEKGISEIDVYGGSGGEQDHYLGNLTVAFLFKDLARITFYDDYSQYFFISKKITLTEVKDKMISLYPFPIAENIYSKGLNWELQNDTLTITSKIGTRNFAIDDEVVIEYNTGDLLVFIGQNYL